ADILIGASVEGANLATSTGIYLASRGEMILARALLERALAISEAAYGSQAPQMAAALANFGSVLQQQSDLVNARRQYERALAIFEAAYGPQHPVLACSLGGRGHVLR